MNALSRMFNPRSVAIIGASNDPNRVGGRPIHYLKQYYEGAVYPINPARDSVQGIKAYPSILDVEEPVDLALIALPASGVHEALEQCIRKGIDACVILSSGFAEEGENGAAMQHQIQETARNAGIRIIGPNCLGVGNNKLGSWVTFGSGAQNRPKIGALSVITQSGGFASYVLMLLNQRQMGLNHWITLGNQADVNFSDSLDFLADDPETRVILGYLEGIEDGDRLIAALRKARRNKKFVVIIKVGSSEAGAIATASHTATLAGSDAVYDAVLRQYGAYRARTIEEAMDVAYACVNTPSLPAGTRTGLITVSGGLGVLMADAAAGAGLDVSALSQPVQDKLKAILPFSNVRNPVDITAQIMNDFSLFERTLDTLVENQECDMVVNYQIGVDYTHMRDSIVAALTKFRGKQPDAIVSLILLPNDEIRAGYEELGYLLFEEPSAPFTALAALCWFAESFEKGDDFVIPAVPTSLPPGAVTLNENDSKRLLAAAGLNVPHELTAKTSEEAVRAAEELGYPVALKLISPDILHKSDIGGVELNITDAQEVASAFQRIMTAASQKAPAARQEGVLIAPMISNGLEFSLGVQNDPVFGPVVMAGLGGVFIEVLKDVSFRHAPVSKAEAHEMLAELRGRAMLGGLRGKLPADVEALADAIVSLSEFAARTRDRIASIDVNPILVLPKGKGAVVVDAVVQLK